MAALLGTADVLHAPAQETTPPAAPVAPPSGSDPTHQEESGAAATRSHIRVRVEVVNVPVTVLNKRGRLVIDLTKDDFQVFEDGVQQNIRYFNRETQIPLRIGMVLDTSNSARRQLSFEKDAATEFAFTVLHAGSSKNQILLQTYDATSSIIQDFTNDPDLLNEKIRGLKAGGGKALYDALYFACREKMLKAGQPEDTRRVLVVISDGLDVQSQHSLDEAISMARKAETLIYTIGNAAYGYTNPGDKILEKISADTGGAAFFPMRYTPGTDYETGYLSHGQIGDTSQNKGLGAETGAFSAERLVRLADSLQAISRELDEQYNIGYTPTRSALDGTYRSIKVVATRRGVTLRWKPGYFASAE
ncbi:MAG: VWA domain-containing protein [Acidobacteriia bacterium]|nr:VWA domain-containing protein [Terriglobia bacterium]